MGVGLMVGSSLLRSEDQPLWDKVGSWSRWVLGMGWMDPGSTDIDPSGHQSGWAVVQVATSLMATNRDGPWSRWPPA